MTLRDACLTHGAPLTGRLTHAGAPVDGPRLLWTIAGLESSHGRDRLIARQEPAYSPGGRYYRQAAHVRQLWARYGGLAASSFGSFQLLYVVVWELGFRGQPLQLQDDALSAQWASTLIRTRLIGRQGAATLDEVLDAYNSGSHLAAPRPDRYIARGLALYEASAADVSLS